MSSLSQLVTAWQEGLLEDNPAVRILFSGATIGVTTVFVLFGTFLYISSQYDWLPAISYEVSPPKKADPPEDWDEPKLKVSGSSTIHCYAPATGEFLGLVNPATAAGIDRSIEVAKVAQEKWSQTSFAKRRQVLRTLLAFILKSQEEIIRVSALDSGKPLVDAALGELLVTVGKLEWTISHGERALRPSKRPTNLIMVHKTNTVYYEPLGVVAALVSWNYPFHNILAPVISAIFAGNGIIVKASESVAWSANYYTVIVKAALTVCGHDPNLVQTIVCWPQTAGHLTSHPDIAHITFIGSRAVGQKVAANAAKQLTPGVIETGGKDAAIVLDSALSDLVRIKDILLRATFQASGQNCIGIERIIACPRVYEPLLKLLEPDVRSIRVGSILDAPPHAPVDMGAIISADRFDHLEKLIKSAVADGARLLVGGSRFVHPQHPRGHYFQPTLLVDVTPEMAISKEESFAPICVLMRAKSTADAVDIHHKSDFGLGASVFGAEGHELDDVVRSLKTGNVAVNDFAVFYAAQMPFGGIGGSGYGKFGGEEGLKGLCLAKSVSKDRLSWLGVKTVIPKGARYPIPDTERAFRFNLGIIEFGYAPGWLGKIGGIWKILRNS